MVFVDANSYMDLSITFFTLTGGNEDRGGAVYVGSQGPGPVYSQVLLVGNKIKDNRARYDGGAIYGINYFSESTLALHLYDQTS